MYMSYRRRWYYCYYLLILFANKLYILLFNVWEVEKYFSRIKISHVSIFYPTKIAYLASRSDGDIGCIHSAYTQTDKRSICIHTVGTVLFKSNLNAVWIKNIGIKKYECWLTFMFIFAHFFFFGQKWHESKNIK